MQRDAHPRRRERERVRLRVLVVGPESSGGRFLAAWLDQHPDLDVTHFSMPHGSGDDRCWPDEGDLGEYDYGFVTCRCREATCRSQVDVHPPVTEEEAALFAAEGIARSVAWCHANLAGRWELAPSEAVVAGHVVGPWFARRGLVCPEPPVSVVDRCASRLGLLTGPVL